LTGSSRVEGDDGARQQVGDGGCNGRSLRFLSMAAMSANPVAAVPTGAERCLRRNGAPGLDMNERMLLAAFFSLKFRTRVSHLRMGLFV
jgi:hypothetical protein